MNKIGDELGQRIRLNQFAPNAEARFDPEDLYAMRAEYCEARDAGRRRRLK
jgi:hypothetical protein